MIENQCFVQVGQDRIEKILSSSQYAALRQNWSIDLRSLKDSNIRAFFQTMEESPSPTGAGSTAAAEQDSQRRLPKKRLLKSFHLEAEAAIEKEYHCQGTMNNASNQCYAS